MGAFVRCKQTGDPMRPISWIHVSDIHMRPHEAWSQKVVMTAMCEDIASQRRHCVLDFVLVTGDLAHSGDVAEYALLPAFFDELVAASQVPRERVFCIPGNHDINRTRQQLCFQGARAHLKNPSTIDVFLGSPTAEDFVTLLSRQEGYRTFRDSYFAGQDRIATDDGLGYVAHITIEDIHVSIIALDSSWLANGGRGDHTRLLIGERQIINAINLIQEREHAPHIVVAMGHHPLHLLQNFDRQSAQTQIDNYCHFYHCGHLHQPEQRTAGLDPSGCLTLTAGASYQSRDAHSTYTIVTLDLLSATRTVRTILCEPNNNTFQLHSSHSYPIEVASSAKCDFGELAQVLKAHTDTPWPYYLAALILDYKAEIVITSHSGSTMASLQFVQQSPTGTDLREETIAFFGFRNVLRVLHGRSSIEAIVRGHSRAVRRYSVALSTLCTTDSSLRNRLDEQEEDAHRLATIQPQSAFAHTLDLLAELASAHDWGLLCEHAERHVDSPYPLLSIQARRSLALGLVHSGEPEDRLHAVTLYQILADLDSPEPSDVCSLATLLADDGQWKQAKVTVLSGIANCSPDVTQQLGEIGYRIVTSTGDRAFRDQLTASIAERTAL